MSSEPTVFVVDDDENVRNSLSALLSSISLRTKAFDSAESFLSSYDPNEWGCLIADVRMPGMNGNDLHQALLDRKILLPIIFVTGHGDVDIAVRAMKHGAVYLLEKPPKPQELLDWVNQAIAYCAEARKNHESRIVAVRRLHTLSPRERQVMDLLVGGKNVKQIAVMLDLSHKTVQIHRTNLMRKLDIDSIADLVRLAASADTLRESP